MNSIQKIESAVYAIRPELKELREGCRIEGIDNTQEIDVPSGTIVRIEPDVNNWSYFYLNTGEKVHEEDINNGAIILGCLITLQDILLCLGGKASISGNGDICTPLITNSFGRIYEITGLKYDLEKSPYEQSTEVIDFIANNIK